MKIILASASERRKTLLSWLIKNFEIIVSDEEEILQKDLSVYDQSKQLAFIKANSVFNKTSGDRIVIGSDTMIFKDGKLYGKPKDNEEAKAILKLLSGSSHEIITSLCVLIQDGNSFKKYSNYDVAKLYLKNMTDLEINNWVENNYVLDKAGSYALQSKFSIFVEKLDGNYTTVVGFPIHKLYDIFKEAGYQNLIVS